MKISIIILITLLVPAGFISLNNESKPCNKTCSLKEIKKTEMPKEVIPYSPFFTRMYNI